MHGDLEGTPVTRSQAEVCLTHPFAVPIHGPLPPARRYSELSSWWGHEFRSAPPGNTILQINLLSSQRHVQQCPLQACLASRENSPADVFPGTRSQNVFFVMLGPSRSVGFDIVLSADLSCPFPAAYGNIDLG